MDFIWFWLAKPISEFFIGVVLIAAIAVIILVDLFFIAKKQGKCSHSNYRENQACDAICRDCGKNLGFIGNVRGRA